MESLRDNRMAPVYITVQSLVPVLYRPKSAPLTPMFGDGHGDTRGGGSSYEYPVMASLESCTETVSSRFT